MKFQEELDRNNKVWKTLADDQLYISGFYTPKSIMIENPSYSKELLQKINTYGITIDSQESKFEDKPYIHNTFIKYHSEKIKIDLSQMSIRKSSQLSYLEIIMPKTIGKEIFKELYNSLDISVEIQTDLNGIESNPSMKLLRSNHRMKFNIDGINLTSVEFTDPNTNKSMYIPYTNHWSFRKILCDDWDLDDVVVSSLILIGNSERINVNEIIQSMLYIITQSNVSQMYCC